MLSEKLQTQVTIDSVSIGLFSQDVRLYGLDIEDLQHRKMLQLDRLSVDVELLKLLQNEVHISQATIDGMRAQLFKPSPDSAANYQFVIDAFKKDKTAEKKEKKEVKDKDKKKLTVELNKVSLNNIHVVYNDQAYELAKLVYKKGWTNSQTATITRLQRSWVSHTKKGDVDNRLTISTLRYEESKGNRQVEIDSLYFFTNNHKPRKNKGKPKRGFFDAGHLDVAAKVHLTILSTVKDSITASIDYVHGSDRGSGLTLKDLKAQARVSKGMLYLSDVAIQLPNTQLNFKSGEVQLPSKKKGIPLAFKTSPINGRVMIKDISRPFAPVLKDFSLPLNLKVTFSGNDNELKFSNVFVSTTDNLLTINANGGITGLKDKYKMDVHFHVGKMVAKGGIKEKIISQFPVKKFMMKQLHALGTITYSGNFHVLWKKETFQGLLSTAAGNAHVNLALDENTKYVYGTVSTDSFMLGKAMDMPKIGKIACKANFKFDISKPRTAIMRKQKGGKLPIGEVSAEVDEAAYKKLKVRNIFVTMVSDGAVADGKMTVKGKRLDVLCGFTFTNTEDMEKMKVKVKPGLKFHGLSDEEKAAKEERKEEKRQAKEERKKQRAEEKAQKKQEKAELKAEKQAMKALDKELKKQEKEQRRQQKAAEKAAKKAAKEAAKEAAKNNKNTSEE